MDQPKNQAMFWCTFIAFLVLSTWASLGCSPGARKGYFVEYGVGGGVAGATEEGSRLVYKAWDYRPSLGEIFASALGGGGGTPPEDWKVVGSGEFSENVVAPSLAGLIKVGWGLTDQFVISTAFNAGKLSVGGLGLTFFQKSTVPSLFYSVVFPYSFYVPPDDAFGDSVLWGDGLSIGVGYEFRKHFATQIDFSFGEYGEFSGRDPSAPLHIVYSDVEGIPTDARTGTWNPVIGSRGYLVRFMISYLYY